MAGMPKPEAVASSPDEQDLAVLRWIAQGFSHAEVAKAAQLASVERSKYYSQRLYRKLGATNAAHAVFLAIQQGWLDPVTGDVNYYATPVVAFDAVRKAVHEAMEVARENLAADIQDQLRQFTAQMAITVTTRENS
jgi:DNA-binding CsgD family transcriptional regulator